VNIMQAHEYGNNTHVIFTRTITCCPSNTVLFNLYQTRTPGNPSPDIFSVFAMQSPEHKRAVTYEPRSGPSTQPGLFASFTIISV
jgi:hypothetical protein